MLARVRDGYRSWRSTTWPMISAPMGKGLATLLVYLSIAFVAASILLVFAPEKGERLRELPLAIIALLAGTLVHTGTRVVRRPRFISGTLVVFGLLLMALLTAWRVMPVFVWGLGIVIGIAWAFVFTRRPEPSSSPSKSDPSA